MKINYNVASEQSSYVTGKTPQTSSKPFTVPVEELTEEKPTQTYKATKQISPCLTQIGAITFQRSDRSYNPFSGGSVNFPEWMQTKTTPTRSDEEILKDIEELAKEHARTGEFHSGEKFYKLIDEYVSSVSPDRESILKNSVKEINERLGSEFPGAANYYSMSDIYRQVDSQRTKEDEYKKDKKEPIDYLMEALKSKEKAKGNSGGTIGNITKNGGYYTVNADYGGGKKSTINYTSSGEFVSMQMQGNNYFVGGISSSGAVTDAQFLNDSGELTMLYNGNSKNLKQLYTKEEGDRLQEMLGVYNATWKAFRNS